MDLFNGCSIQAQREIPTLSRNLHYCSYQIYSAAEVGMTDYLIQLFKRYVSQFVWMVQCWLNEMRFRINLHPTIHVQAVRERGLFQIWLILRRGVRFQ